MTASTEYPPEIPDKLFFRIGEVSRIARLPSSVLRFWENEFPRIRPKRTDAGQRLYRKSDVELILSIKHLLYHRKFTIKGARQYLKAAAGESPSANAPPSKTNVMKEVLDELKTIRSLLE